MLAKRSQIRFGGYLTKVLDVYCTAVSNTRVVDRRVRSIGNRRSIATLCNLQTMNVKPRGLGNLLVDFCC
jgi:hypothetical protein